MMPAGDLKTLKKVVESISEITDDFIILSIHDDVDIVIPKNCKLEVMQAFADQGFISGVKGNKKCLYGAEPAIQYYNSPSRSAVIVDLHTGLYYNGLMPNTFVPIDEKFQKYVSDTKVKTDDIWKYRLSPESEVVHTVCRIIFDKRCAPPHYRVRLEKNIDKCDESELRYAFDIALFKFGKRAFELVMKKKFDNLYQEYISYSDY